MTWEISTVLVSIVDLVSSYGGLVLRAFSSQPTFASLIFLLSSGGKGGAATIENDHDFSVALSALLKKKKDSCGVGVEFDADSMDGYRIKKCVCLPFQPLTTVMFTMH